MMRFWMLSVLGFLAFGGSAHAFSPQRAPTPARITILYDAFGGAPGLTQDWGFAALIEYQGHRILFDTGDNAAIFEHNVRALHVDLRRLDFAVISHRHGDHIAGLSYLLRVNPQVRIYAPRENFGVFGSVLPRSFYRADPALRPRGLGGPGAEAVRHDRRSRPRPRVVIAAMAELRNGSGLNRVEVTGADGAGRAADTAIAVRVMRDGDPQGCLVGNALPSPLQAAAWGPLSGSET